MTTQAIKPGPKRTATSTGKPDQRQRDNKGTPGNTPSLKPSKSTPKKQNYYTTTNTKKIILIDYIIELVVTLRKSYEYRQRRF